MSTGSVQPFVASGTATISASTISASAPLSQGDTALVFNASANVAFVTFGNGSAIATLGGTPVPPGGSLMLYVGPVVNFAAVLLSAGSGNVYFSAGTGTAR